MRSTQYFIFILCLFPISLRASGAPPKPAPAEAERFLLGNGLTVIVRPVAGAKEVALVVLYKIGGDHDPQGRSGMAHMVEHLLITAAAGRWQARTAEAFFERYRSGGNAQTGDRYTIVATVFPKAEFEDELREAAARMGELRLTDADLERERPRLLAEVANMFGRIPSLGVVNQARELVRPTPQGGRKGGLPEHLAAMTREEVQARYERYYKPSNAILVLAGTLDTAKTRASIEAAFAKLPPGTAIPPASKPGAPRFEGRPEQAIDAPEADAETEVCLAYQAPDPASDLYAPFLVLVNRLWTGTSRLGASPGRTSVDFRLLDDPAILAVRTRRNRGETPRQTRERLERFVASAIEPKLGVLEGAFAQQAFGYFLGTARIPEPALATNLYGVAFSLARREQLGIDPERLAQALGALTDHDLRRAAKEVFAPVRSATASLPLPR